MSARLGPEWRALVEALRDDAAARRDLANTDTAIGATEVYAANDLVRAADRLLAAEGSRDMRESHPVAPGGADTGAHDGGLASPAHVPASPAPAPHHSTDAEMDAALALDAAKLLSMGADPGPTLDPADPEPGDDLDSLLDAYRDGLMSNARGSGNGRIVTVEPNRGPIHAEVQRREAAAMESLRRDIASAMDNEVMVGNTAVDVRCVALAVVDRYLRSAP